MLIRPLGLAVAFAIACLAGACLDEELLLGQDCLTDEDCARGQTCSITTYQQNTPMGFGSCADENQCRPEGSPQAGCCTIGDQDGCFCTHNPGEGTLTCEGSRMAVRPCYDGSGFLSGADLDTCRMEEPVDPSECICIPL